MELELGARLPRRRCSSTALAMVRERAARARHRARARDRARRRRRCCADELRLKQVVLNLLTQRRQVHARRRRVDVPRPVASGDELEVTVRDTGIGIAEAEQERIFEAFQRGGAARARRARARASVSRSRGASSSCTAAACGWSSASGRAARSRFAIPQPPAAGAQRDAARGRRATAIPSRRRSSLVIEDDPPLRRAAARCTSSDAGFAVAVGARRRARALELARRLRARRRRPRHPAARHERLGRARRSSRATRDRPAIPVVVVVDARRARHAASRSARRSTSSSRSTREELLARGPPLRRRRPDAGDRTVVVDRRRPARPRARRGGARPAGLAGHRVRRRRGGRRARARASAPRSCSLDLLMPEVDGFAVVERAARRPGLGGRPDRRADREGR